MSEMINNTKSITFERLANISKGLFLNPRHFGSKMFFVKLNNISTAALKGSPILYRRKHTFEPSLLKALELTILVNNIQIIFPFKKCND